MLDRGTGGDCDCDDVVGDLCAFHDADDDCLVAAHYAVVHEDDDQGDGADLDDC